MSLYRSQASAPQRLRQAAALFGPLFALMEWTLNPPDDLPQTMLAVLAGWALVALAMLWLARRVELRRELIAPAS